LICFIVHVHLKSGSNGMIVVKKEKVSKRTKALIFLARQFPTNCSA